MRRVRMTIAVVLLAGTMLVAIPDSPLPVLRNVGPSRVMADDIQVSMPKEASGFNGRLLGQIVKPVAKEGWFTMKVIKVVSYSPANKTKVNVDALTAAWKGQYDWCANARGAAPCPLFVVGDFVIFEGFQNEAHLRYTKVTKQDEVTVGTVTEKNAEAGDAKANPFIEIKTERGQVLRFAPPATAQGPDPAVVALIASSNVGDRVQVNWFGTGEDNHATAIKVLRAAGAGAATPKPPANSSSPTSAPDVRPATAATSQPAETTEKASQDKLKLVQMYLDNGLKAQAKDILQAIIKEYPDTAAAKDAKAKLAELGG